MKPTTAIWVRLAEGDYAVAGRELSVTTNPAYEVVCYHAQQAAEKYLKAYLEEQRQPVPKTHELLDLLRLCLIFTQNFAVLHSPLSSLNSHDRMFRYPSPNQATLGTAQTD